MHIPSKKMSILLVALLAFSMLSGILPLGGATGNILINTTTAPSPVVTIRIGEAVSLYFGYVTWSGGQIDLYVSTDGHANLSIPDIPNRYGPTFSVAIVTASAIDTTTYPGYSVGYDWINSTIPETLEIPGGNYYIKAFDGSSAAVAVTDNYIGIVAAFEVIPDFGPGQASLQLRGYALPANDYANLSFNDGTGWVKIQDLVPADELGRFVYSMSAPDLMKPGTEDPGLHDETLVGDGVDIITFRMIVNATLQEEWDTFDEYRRGLKQAKGKTGILPSYPLLVSNGTDLSVLVDVEALCDLVIAGKWFHPGTLTIYWDKTTTIGTAVANSTHGWFNTTVTVPIASIGKHNVTIDDGKTIFWFDINVVPTFILVPDEGTVGTHVNAYGFGFPASDDVKYNVTLWWDFVDPYAPYPVNLTAVQTDSNGYFATTFTVPQTVGGDHMVNATADDYDQTWAADVFTVIDLSDFPLPFAKDDVVNSTVVIGTSDPHGPCGSAHTLDTVGGMGVTAVLGTYGSVADCRFYLDTDIAWYNETEWKVHYWPVEGLTNIITTAGPGVNMITWRYFCNPWYAPVYMYYDGGLGEWVIVSPTETYASSDWIGTDPLTDLVVLEVIYVKEEGRYVLWIGGFGGYATRAGCLVLQLFDSGELPFELEGRAMLIQWIDENGNAKVDPEDTWNVIEIVP